MLSISPRFSALRPNTVNQQPNSAEKVSFCGAPRPFVKKKPISVHSMLDQSTLDILQQVNRLGQKVSSQYSPRIPKGKIKPCGDGLGFMLEGHIARTPTLIRKIDGLKVKCGVDYYPENELEITSGGKKFTFERLNHNTGSFYRITENGRGCAHSMADFSELPELTETALKFLLTGEKI